MIRCSFSARNPCNTFDVSDPVTSKLSRPACFCTTVRAPVCRFCNVANKSGATSLYSNATCPNFFTSSTNCFVCGFMTFKYRSKLTSVCPSFSPRLCKASANAVNVAFNCAGCTAVNNGNRSAITACASNAPFDRSCGIVSPARMCRCGSLGSTNDTYCSPNNVFGRICADTFFGILLT